MKRYVLGFMFDYNMKNVCLIKKNRPQWQAGKLNGVGGKIESDEHSIQAMIREFQEETSVYTDMWDWKNILCMKFDDVEIEIFTCVDHNMEYLRKVKTMTDEEVGVISVRNGEECIENIPALLELCIQYNRMAEGRMN